MKNKRDSILLNICCGDDYREGYINIDFSDKRSDGKSIKVDLVHDITVGLPFEDNSVEEIVFREAGEHFNRHWLPVHLKEFFRILKSGGQLDMTVPPALKQLKMLMLTMQAARNLTWADFEQAHERFSVWKYMDDLMGATHLHSKGDSHLSLWTPEMLRVVVEHCNFKIISLDDNIFLRAVKP